MLVLLDLEVNFNNNNEMTLNLNSKFFSNNLYQLMVLFSIFVTDFLFLKHKSDQVTLCFYPNITLLTLGIRKILEWH